MCVLLKSQYFSIVCDCIRAIEKFRAFIFLWSDKNIFIEAFSWVLCLGSKYFISVLVPSLFNCIPLAVGRLNSAVTVCNEIDVILQEKRRCASWEAKLLTAGASRPLMWTKQDHHGQGGLLRPFSDLLFYLLFPAQDWTLFSLSWCYS